MTIWRRRRRHDAAAGLSDLEAALHDQGCPVCARAAAADECWLDRFLDDGYLERDVVRRIAAGGGFCAFHAGRMAAIGQSATVALVYLKLVEYCLPRLAIRRDRPVRLLAILDQCEACAQQGEVERRECFFLALLIRERGLRCYGTPALVCMRHLPPLLGYLGERHADDILALHLDAVASLRSERDADAVIGMLLGPPQRPSDPPPLPWKPEGADIPDPVSRMLGRLRDLPSCAICAEISDARGEWLGWLANASRTGDGEKIADVLPLCREHVWQAHSVAGGKLAPALAALVRHEAGQRLIYAAEAAAACGGSRRMFDRLGRAFGATPARRAALASLRRKRECPLCARLRDADERALALVAALIESTEGHRAFESGYGLCVRHTTRSMAEAPPLSEIAAHTAHARLRLLRWNLEEQLRRSAWQARPIRRGIESAAWLAAGARFSGTV